MHRNADDMGQAIVMEEGEIFFFYRPKNGRDPDDKAASGRRFFMVLHPSRKSMYRLIAFGRKYPPVARSVGPGMQASVDKVMSTLDELRTELLGPDLRNGRWSLSMRPGAIQAAEGIYAILKYRDRTHLIYALDYPIRDNGILEEMGVFQEGGYTAVVRNPDKPGAGGFSHFAPYGVRAEFPLHLRDLFRGRDDIPVDPVEFLNEEGAELFLTGVPQGPLEEAGVEANSRNGFKAPGH